MYVSRSTEESVRLIATALGSLADTLAKMAGSLEELEVRVEHIESYLEENTGEGEEEVIEHDASLLPCGDEQDTIELDRWYSDGGHFLG